MHPGLNEPGIPLLPFAFAVLEDGTLSPTRLTPGLWLRAAMSSYRF